MSITPVSGEIKAQPLNDNFSYLDSEKADYTMVKGLGTGLGGTAASLSQLNSQYPTGEDGFWITQDTNHYYIWKGNAWADMGLFQEAQIAPESIDLDKTDFSIIVSKNLFNKKTAVSGALNSAGGISANTNYYTSDYIKVVTGTTVKTSSNMQSFAYYRSDKTLLSANISAGVNTADVPINTQYIRVTFYYTNLSTFMLSVGSLPTSYEEYRRELEPNVIGEVPGEKIIDNTVSKNKTTFFIAGKNKANPENKIVGKYVNPATGGLEANKIYNSYHLLPVEDFGKYTFTSIRFIAFYDKNKKNLGDLSISEPLNPSPYSTSIIDERVVYFTVSYKIDYDNLYQIEEGGTPSSYVPFGVMIDGLTIPKSLVYDDTDGESAANFNMPPKIYALVNEKLGIVKRNLSFTDYNYLYSTAYKATSTTGNYSLATKAYVENAFITEKQSTIIVTKARSSELKVLLLGDSIVRSFVSGTTGNFSNELKKIMGSTLKTVGTMTGAEGEKFEGRGGWTAAKYRTDGVFESVINPFYNPSTKDFDFNYYLSNSSIDVPDVVIINLGTNDIFNYKTDESLKEDLPSILDNFEFIVNSIKSVNSTIKVAVNLTIPPTLNEGKWRESYGEFTDNYQELWRYRQNNVLWVNELIKNSADTYDLIPVYLGIDTEKDIADGVHPNLGGYAKMAKQISCYLNSL
ncbi:SGNH/GDSL hydrolase family protein [Enterococcus rotai]|uniref:SGNH/GDSL hydrolase family protein n=1 Tax=Enterococcus rotai TaxID=118060 RepID=UPI0032B4198B